MAFRPYVEEGGLMLLYWKYAFRSKSNKPYKKPLPYEMFEVQDSGCINTYTDWTFSVKKGEINIAAATKSKAWMKSALKNDGSNGSLSLAMKNELAATHNRALSKVADQLSYVSNLFEAWYERKEAYTLLGQCVKSIHNLVKGWRNPRFWKNFMSSAGKTARQPKTLPEAWLLMQFAIKPLIGTIDDCITLLCSSFPAAMVEGSSKYSPSTFAWVNGSYESYYLSNAVYIVKIGVEVTAFNPNAALANIFGGTTPVSTFLNVVPWVWAVNYFVNLNDVVSNLEVRFPGVVVGSAYTTQFNKATAFGERKMYGQDYMFGGYDNRGNVIGISPTSGLYKYDAVATYMKRTVSSDVPAYKLERKFPALGSNQLANLTSALALAFQGKK